MVYIINLQTKQILYSYQLSKYSKVTNVVIDPFRQLIYVINNQSLTLVFSYKLNLITTLQNACLKQAKISYDSDFVYSICPNDVIIYNGLSFQQQFPIVDKGIKEVENFISTKYNNYFIIIQKNKLSLIKMEYLSDFQLVYEVNKTYQQLLNMKVTRGQNYQTYIELLLSSYDNVQHQIVPLQQNQNCYINIQQQNRPIENVYTTVQLFQSFSSIKSFNQQLSLIQINYQDQQCIQGISDNLYNLQNIDSNTKTSLTIQSSSQQENICWLYSDKNNFSSYIENFYLKNMNLSLQNAIVFNQKKQMKNFQMFNMTLNIQSSLTLTDFDKVLFQNIKFDNQRDGQNQIIIQNCKLVIIEQVDIIDILSQQIIFTLTNNSNVIIQNINISKMNGNTIFQMDNNYQVVITDIKIQNSSYINVFQLSLSNFFNATNLIIQSVLFSQVLKIQGATISKIQHIEVDNCYQLQLIQLQPIKLENLQYLSKYYMLQDLNLQNSTDISLVTQSEQTQISDIIIQKLNTSLNCFTINALQLSLNNFTIQNSIVYLSQPSVIFILSYTDCDIQNINSSKNQITILKINQQNFISYTQIHSSSFIDFTLQNPVMEFINAHVIILDQIQVQNILLYDNMYSSIIIMNQCNNITINESHFINNTNTIGTGGSIYATDNQFIQIKNTVFKQNQCQLQNGGALSIKNNIEMASLTIKKSAFIDNQALLSTGGAINLVNSNLMMENSVVSSNQALIGGGIYYQQIIPDFVLDLTNKIINNNIISQNFAKLYGNNLGSTLRSIKINLNDIETSKKTQIIENQNSQIYVNSFKSGDQINFNKIQLLDEEDHPIFIPSNDNTNTQQYSNDVQSILQQISVSLQWDQSTQQIQCLGELQSKQFTNNGFKLNAQIMYKPNNQMILQIVSNLFPKISDSKGNVYLKQQQLYKNITINFNSCQLGQITKQQSNSIVCEDCPEGKYSLSLQDSSCLHCPDSAVKCYQSTILLKNGYWRENEFTDQIIYCHFRPNSCQAESQISKEYCITGYKGPLCYSCDTFGEIWGKKYQQIFSQGECYSCEENSFFIITQNLVLFIIIFCYLFALLRNIINKQQTKLAGYFITKMDLVYLGSTLRQQDKPQIISKILTDHLQILSLLSFFNINIPNYFKLPIQVSGNSLSLTSKSIDCFFSRYPNLKPLWFYQSLWSLCLPLSILSLYLILGFILSYLKKNTNIFKYLNTACIFIYLYFYPMIIMLFSRSLNCIQIGDKSYLDLDINILCYDPQDHKPYVIFYCLPLLLLWAIIVPLFLFLKIRNGKIKKWSIIIEIKYSFIFAGYKEKYYYWEFAKLIYKSILILIATLLQQNSFLKLSMLNAIILLQIYIIFKAKPFTIQNFNNLLQRSAILCALSLNLTQIIASVTNMNFILEAILITLLIFSNLQFITQLVIGICLITIQNDRQKRSRIQNCLLYFISKYPSLFENIQVQQGQVKVSSLLKIKLVKNKVKHLVKYLKQYNFFNQESLQQHFNIQRTQIFSPQLELQQQASRFTLLSGNENIIRQHKKINSFKSMREKWSYYTRKTKESPINVHSLDSQDKIQNTHKEIALTENMQSYTSNTSHDEFGIQITSENKLNKNLNHFTKKQ
ncbi:transmembrane protein, putative (macronuclear) [Tetrahymena thermophila SB210]|uniref:Transmembrane protein, putative n=2 Tax=Tetrahymena thermophila (strain SB210) TaxID=312017 RepID=W7XLG5_TETTS|nr:transmembrane protein, putative [Tetrahymena thermophila SB210]EWS76249.1 transmembrane protein, putative [Tetrahymena thermophila SB210]|eukprot:XP_012651208.1 transmembrane protein, putative [Tetrahymena thermophila SB210]